MKEPREYTTRPKLVRAIQWTGENLDAVQSLAGFRKEKEIYFVANFTLASEIAGIPLSEDIGALYVSENHWKEVGVGSWIIKDDSGVYALTAEAFSENYSLKTTFVLPQSNIPGAR